jgi:hypothetical protein
MTHDVPPDGPARSPRWPDHGWPALAGTGNSAPLLDLAFDLDNLPAIREGVQACAIQFGFSDDRATDMVLAIHELAANAIVHGGGAGRLRVWKLAGALRCEVDDGDLMRSVEGRDGRNGSTGSHSGSARDSVSVNSLPCEPGHGLSVVQYLADQTQSLSGPRGTSVMVIFGPFR